MPRRRCIVPPQPLHDIEHRYRVHLTLIYHLRTTLRASRLGEGRPCRILDGYKDPKGYGQVRMGRRMHWAHRVFYCLFIGPVPYGLTVHHRCLNPSCVEVSHLELRTIASNTAEANRRRAAPTPSTIHGIPL